MNRKLIVILAGILLIALSLPVSGHPPMPSLLSTLHRNPFPLQTYDVTLTTPTRAFVWNFTVDSANKDVGSDSFAFVVDAVEIAETTTTFVYLFSNKNLTDWLSSPLTVHSGQRLAYWSLTSPKICDGTGSCGSAYSFHFVPPASGLYHIVIANNNALQNRIPGVQSTYHIEIHGLETWTTTTIG